MIGSAAPASLDEFDRIATLFRRLGYPVRSAFVDASGWARCGALPAGQANVSLLHLCRAGSLDLYAVDSTTDDASAEAIIRSLRRWNAVLTPCIVRITADRVRFFHHTGSTVAKVAIDLHGDRNIDLIERLRLRDDEIDPAAVITMALSRDRLTSRFFRRFRDAWHSVSDELRTAAHVRHSDADGEALRLLSRLLFLQFVQKRGWLDGDRHFLSRQLHDALQLGRPVYRSVVAPLFFGCLNTPIASRSPAARRLGRIPYLNGGLFEMSRIERKTPFDLPDELIASLVDDLFGQYDFVIDESDDESFGIDPEMLGRVFESLMETDERARSGTFYTPRLIVEETTSEALAAVFSRFGIDADAVRRIAAGGGAEPSPDAASIILRETAALRILDPACGSGAFLLCALKQIERLTSAAARICDTTPPTRSQIVERNLHGVDIKPEAVRLCELRLWLAIVAATSCEIEDVPPLPNLDRNVMQGNALLSPLDFLGHTRRATYHRWRREIETNRQTLERYRHANRDEKPELARLLRLSDRRIAAAIVDSARKSDDVVAIQRHLGGEGPATRRSPGGESLESIARSLDRDEIPFFSFDVHFAHVVADGGFDLVIGNPPWVRGSRIPENERRQFVERYGRPTRVSGPFPQSDLALFFLARSIALARAGGVVSLLMPAKLLTARYASAWRAEISTHHRLVALRDWTGDEQDVFDADTFPLSLTLVKGETASSEVRVATASGSHRVDPLRFDCAGTRWSLLPDAIEKIRSGLHSSHRTLQDVLGRMPLMGVKTGDNARFIFHDVAFDDDEAILPFGDIRVPRDAVCRIVRGRDLRAWTWKSSAWMIWPPSSDTPPPWVVELARLWSCTPDEIRLAYVRPEHRGLKVAWKDVARRMEAAVLPLADETSYGSFPLVPNQTLYMIDATSTDEADALCAIFNSRTFNAISTSEADVAKDGHFRFFGSTIASLPFPDIESLEWKQFVRYARRNARGGRANIDLERLVGKLYGINESDRMRFIEAVEASRR